ncbi:hypothetical protein [Planomicrobium sp. YIM 101495]|uniref:hypothetical protein n=1 Tax=Planomicrobium sp. YIM 101495 TaxID=2665160 RepID=UPI0012B71E9C|nr:hypothetical protein [Planomicrobium sp. YIM 101495]MTD30682.1 hypothetical protein [Planomicrobium sp. YIM 101495]
MADWVENLLVVSGDELALEKWNQILGGADGTLVKLSFEALVPSPKEERDDFSWELTNWGTKWNTAPHGMVEQREEGIFYAFMTPWDPPLPLLETMFDEFPELSFELRYRYQYTTYSSILRKRKSIDFTATALPVVYRKLIDEPFDEFQWAFRPFG